MFIVMFIALYRLAADHFLLMLRFSALLTSQRGLHRSRLRRSDPPTPLKNPIQPVDCNRQNY